MYFQQGRLTFGQVMYQFLERSPQDTQDGFGLYSAQASFAWLHVDLVQPLLRKWFQPFWIISFKFVKVCWIHFSSWESFIGFYIWCYPINFFMILACLNRIYRWGSNFVEKVVLEREHSGRDAILCLLPCVLWYCVEGGLEKIMTKLRLSLKDNNNNQLQSKFHLAFI